MCKKKRKRMKYTSMNNSSPNGLVTEHKVCVVALYGTRDSTEAQLDNQT